ncbi:MAG TPA: hypothetical protein VFT08_07000 [Pyrinomonadaceae bacterium]|nr:hypothetical protein [Pyrinomonadaceae bacterium]
MGRSKVLFAALFLFLMVTVVNAYTIVMRDGRRVEIPNEFTVTNSTLTYHVGRGMQVTVQLNTVDIGATERANGEAQGSFLMRASAPKAGVEPAPQTRRAGAGRSITNGDLEKFRLTRVENENQRKALGLPSLEERQRETALIEDRTLEQVRSMRAQEEAYWRSRADALRAEMAANEARQRPDQIPWSFSSSGFPAFGPFDGFGFGVTGGPFNRFGRFRPSPFDGFLATPITPFPTFPFIGRRQVFTAPGIRPGPRIVHPRHGSRR